MHLSAQGAQFGSYHANLGVEEVAMVIAVYCSKASCKLFLSAEKSTLGDRELNHKRWTACFCGQSLSQNVGVTSREWAA